MNITKWEYQVLHSRNYVSATKLSELGEAGWEMCGTHTAQLQDYVEVIVYMKRPVQKPIPTEVREDQ